jgi:hypothetical protein
MKVQIDKQLKLFVIRGTLFLIVFFVIDFIIGGLMHMFYFSQEIRDKIGIKKTNSEIVIIGSSRAQNQYIPKIFTDSLGLSCFNMGSGGQNIYYHYAIISSILERYTPKIILLDLISIDYTVTDAAHNTDRLSVLLPYYKTRKEVREIINLRGPLERIKLMSRIYPFNSWLTTIINSYLKNDRNIQFKDGGYIPLHGKLSQSLPSYRDKNLYKVDYEKVAYLEKTISLCKQQHVRLIIINSPSFSYNSAPDKIIEDIAEKNRIEFWNYENNELLMKPEYFYDPYNLNEVGAKEFSKMIANRLK